MPQYPALMSIKFKVAKFWHLDNTKITSLEEKLRIKDGTTEEDLTLLT